MKKLRISNEGEVEDKINMANVLMLLSRGHHRVEEVNGEKEDDSPMMMSSTLRRRRHEGRVFECKTCNRQFHSFQALGGHRASHKKPTLAQKKPNGKAHECSICGLEFGVGQALGGHMRRHRAIVKMNVNDEAGFRANKKRLVLLDLNLLPPNDDDDDDDDDEMEGSKIGLGMGLELICR